MMAFPETTEYDAYSVGDIIGIRLPYGREQIAFYAFVPFTDDNEDPVPIDDFVAELTGETLTEMLNDFGPMDFGSVQLPKLKITYEKSLDDILEILGMEAAYTSGFNNMLDGDTPIISEVKHKAFVEINEEGTEAAAATTVEVVLKGMPASFIADKPFVFFIRDDRNGTILFMGKVEDPTAG